jgi:hypothetical protein
MKAYQRRIVAERTALDNRRSKLITFIGSSEEYDFLPAVERARINFQLKVMNMYSGILSERIAAFEPEYIVSRWEESKKDIMDQIEPL